MELAGSSHRARVAWTHETVTETRHFPRTVRKLPNNEIIEENQLLEISILAIFHRPKELNL